MGASPHTGGPEGRGEREFGSETTGQAAPRNPCGFAVIPTKSMKFTCNSNDLSRSVSHPLETWRFRAPDFQRPPCRTLSGNYGSDNVRREHRTTRPPKFRGDSCCARNSAGSEQDDSPSKGNSGIPKMHEKWSSAEFWNFECRVANSNFRCPVGPLFRVGTKLMHQKPRPP